MRMNISYIENLLARALQSGATLTGYSYEKANEYLKKHASDKRYKLFALAGCCSWTHNEHGVIQYMRKAFDYQQREDRYEVKHRPGYPRDLMYA